MLVAGLALAALAASVTVALDAPAAPEHRCQASDTR
jgi:hypothetical protein